MFVQGAAGGGDGGRALARGGRDLVRLPHGVPHTAEALLCQQSRHIQAYSSFTTTEIKKIIKVNRSNFSCIKNMCFTFFRAENV